MHEGLVWHPSVLPPPEKERVFESLPQALCRLAEQWPDRPAVTLGSLTLTFHDLARRAAGLAEDIRVAAHATSGPVALVQSIGLDAVAAWFAVSMAGRPLVLLEPDHPPARLMELMEAAGCAMVVADERTAPALAGLPVRVLMPTGRLGQMPRSDGLGAGEPALIFPTSGSTGSPKLVTYAATTLAAKVQSSIRLMRVPQGARVLIAGSHGNYGFLHHALVFLMSGGTLCLADVKREGFAAVIYAVERDGARHVRFTPSMFRQLAAWPAAGATLGKLQGVRFSGEPLLATDLALAESLLDPACLIQNVYGSTESALFIWTHDRAQPWTGATVPIGHIYPMAAYAIAPLEPGNADAGTGELIIRSAFQALGDFREGQIDTTRFPPAPDGGPERCYATGDLVQTLPDGGLVHLGRLGRMAKVRGNRVFLAEVENHLRAVPGVTGAAVVDCTEPDGSVVLHGLITGDDDPRIVRRVSAAMSAQLPDFMRPRHIRRVEQMPLLPGGKIDYTTLLARVDVLTRVTLPDQGDWGRLAAVWDAVLWPGAHARDDSFESLGGDSLKLMTLSIDVEQTFGRPMPLEAFMDRPTLRHLAELLDVPRPTAADPRTHNAPVATLAPRRRHLPSWRYRLAVRLNAAVVRMAEDMVRLIALGVTRETAFARIHAWAEGLYPWAFWLYRRTRPEKHHATFRRQWFKLWLAGLQKIRPGYTLPIRAAADNDLARLLEHQQPVIVVSPHLRITTVLGHYLECRAKRLAVVANSDPNETHLNFGMKAPLDFIRADGGSLLQIRQQLRAGSVVLVMPDYEIRSPEQRLSKYISPHIFECIEKLKASAVFMWVDLEASGQVSFEFVAPPHRNSRQLAAEFVDFVKARMPWNVTIRARTP